MSQLTLKTIVTFLERQGFTVMYRPFPPGVSGLVMYDDRVVWLDFEQIVHSPESALGLLRLLQTPTIPKTPHGKCPHWDSGWCYHDEGPGGCVGRAHVRCPLEA